MKIVLGSQSPGRKRVLQRMGYEFEVMPADIDEKAIRFDDPTKLTLALADAKAEAILSKLPSGKILITSDQVVLCGGKIREKPENESEAEEFLKSYMFLPAETVTAVVVSNTTTRKRAGGVDIAKIWIKPLPASVISEYISSGDAALHSGEFDHEHPILKPYIDRIEGDPDSVTGLPGGLTKRLIEEV